jgi:hypothetical protein
MTIEEMNEIENVIIDDPLNQSVGEIINADPPKKMILAQIIPRHRPEGEGGVSAYISMDDDGLTIAFQAEACDVTLLIDARVARTLLTELQREVPELEEILNEGEKLNKESEKKEDEE